MNSCCCCSCLVLLVVVVLFIAVVLVLLVVLVRLVVETNEQSPHGSLSSVTVSMGRPMITSKTHHTQRSYDGAAYQ